MPKPSCHESHGRKPSIKGKGTFFLKNAKNRQRIRPLFQPFSNGAKTRPCRERITIFTFFAFSSRFFRARPFLLDFPFLDTARGRNEVEPDFEELAGISGERLGIAFFLNLLQSFVRACISKTGERRGRHYLPVGEEARQRGEVRAAYQGKGRDRKGLHLS